MKALFVLALFFVFPRNTWAQEDGGPEEVPALDGTIVKVPTGSQVSILGDGGTFTPYGVPSKYWLLPDSYYRNAVTAGKQLQICQPALDTCTETALAWQERTYTALQTCSDQFGSDSDQITGLIIENGQLSFKLAKARNNQVVAWAITSGLLVGTGTVLIAILSTK